jgi:hypothetical protein
MTAYTLTKNTTLRDLTVAGGYSARSGGDSITNTNGWSLTIDQDSQYGHGSPAIGATTSGSLGSITQTAASGGDIIVDSRYVRLIPFNTGSGTLTIDGSTQTIGSATCIVIGIYTAMNVAPATTGASGWLKVTAWNSVAFPTSGAFTKSGFTFTITGASVPGWIEIVGDDAATMTLNRLGKFQVLGAYYEIGTTDGNRATTYQIPNNGKQLYVPAIQVQGAAWSITGATWSAGVATFTTSATHDMLVGQPVTITGVTPSGYNCVDQFITDLTDNTFKVAMSDPGAYTSGGTAQTYEQYPCAGTLACTAANWVANEDTRRGKVFWNTNATTSLTLPLGVVRFGHDGTNSSGAFCPPAGRKIRIANAIFTNCTTAARNQNVLPNATLATRYDFTMTGAGQINIDKATMCWYLSSTQGYSVEVTNSSFMSQISVTECPTVFRMTNVAIGQEAAVAAVACIITALNPGGTVFKNVVGTQAATTGTSGSSVWTLGTSESVELTDCVGWLYGFRTASNVKLNNFTVCPNMVQTRFHHIGIGVTFTNCANMSIVDTKYTDTTGVRQTTNATGLFQPSSPLTYGVISGLKYVGYRAQNWGTVFNPSSQCSNVKFRNIGSLSSPLLTGDGPYRDLSWSRTTTVCTVTHTAHGLVVGDNFTVYHNSSTSAIALGAKTVASVPTANTFTFACTNGGDASGTLSYFFCNVSGWLPNSGGTGYKDVLIQRVYMKFNRSGMAADNSNNNVIFENSYVTFDPTYAAATANTVLNNTSKLGLPPVTSGSASVYGSTWCDGVIGVLPDTLSYTWTRATASFSLTTTTGYHNAFITNTSYVEVLTSSDETALNVGVYPITLVGTGGDLANRLRVSSNNAGAASGTATMNLETGRVVLFMNEGTAENTHYTFTAGTPKFNGAGFLTMFSIGDQAVFETPYWIKGHTAFMKFAPAMNTATIANYWLEYQIDTGSGYGAWKTAFRQTATAVADGVSGALTLTGLAAGDTWIVNGDRIQATTIGNVNRDAVVVSGGGTTTLTLNKPHNTTITNTALQVFSLPNETITDPINQGFKLKIRITTLVANTQTIGPITFRTLQTAASRQVQLPLDTNTVTFSGLPTGCDAVVLTAGTSTILDQQDSIAGTSYSYVFSGAQTVDVGFIKPGYVPLYIRNLALTADDSIIPVSLTADRNYL